jgi:MFS family permease
MAEDNDSNEPANVKYLDYGRRQGQTKDDDSWEIPPPPSASKHKIRVSSASTPLLPIRERKSQSSKRSRKDSSAQVLFGDSVFGSPTRSTSAEGSYEQEPYTIDDARPTGISKFFFGFMYEEPFNQSFDYDGEEDRSSTPPVWNRLNIVLFATYSLTTAATAVPILLLSTVGQEFVSDAGEAASFTSRAASSAVLGAALGKFLIGPVGDVLGARRTSVLFSVLLSLALLGLAFAGDSNYVVWACFYVEFFQSVQWPCILVILATHYGSSHHAYEGGIYVTSVASRFGSLMGIPIFSVLLRHSHWRAICLIGAWIAMIGSSVSYLFLMDSPARKDEPQNPLHPKLLYQIGTAKLRSNPGYCIRLALNVVRSIFVTNLLPSLQHVLKSGTFWIVAVAHTGASMVRTSERILGTYYHDTSNGSVSETKAAGLVVFSSLGTIVGLGIVGSMFTERKERQRKWLVSRLYVIAITACYFLAFLAIPWVRYQIDAPGLILFFQVAASSVMAFSMAVAYYHIPGLVGSAFGNHKGLFSAYTDGVAYAISSIVWRIVASAVGNGSTEGGGWSYGWAAVALLIILCGILMVEFMEHYFVRASGRHHGNYETILFA